MLYLGDVDAKVAQTKHVNETQGDESAAVSVGPTDKIADMRIAVPGGEHIVSIVGSPHDYRAPGA